MYRYKFTFAGHASGWSQDQYATRDDAFIAGTAKVLEDPNLIRNVHSIVVSVPTVDNRV